MGTCGQQKLISACAHAQSNRSRCKYAPILCAYILTTRVLSVRPTIARCNEFCAPFNRFQLFKKDGRVVLNSCVQRNRELHHRGFPRSLVAVGGVEGGQWRSEAQCILDKASEIRSQFLSLCCLILPYNQEKKSHPSAAGLTERHFQSPAERSWIRNRIHMYFNRASVITWDCMSEINGKQSKYF